MLAKISRLSFFNPLGLVISLCFLAGCNSAKESLGLNRQAPDEFAVVKRAPLEMPPNYSLRPPKPGAPRPQEMQTAEQARKTVLGTTTSEAAGESSLSGSEQLFIQKAGADKAAPDIRRLVDVEAENYEDENQPVVDKILGRESKTGVYDVLDPKAEADRLKGDNRIQQSTTDRTLYE